MSRVLNWITPAGLERMVAQGYAELERTSAEDDGRTLILLRCPPPDDGLVTHRSLAEPAPGEQLTFEAADPVG